jgi:hypothetical protein
MSEEKAKESTKRASEGGNGTAATPAASVTVADTKNRLSWRGLSIVAIILLGLALIGFALTDYAPEHASWFWVLILPAFAALGIWDTWRNIRNDGKTNWSVVRIQIYHWIALFVAIKVLFLLIYSGNISGHGGGLMALLLMALTCALVGVNFDRVFIFVGILLCGSVLAGGWFQQYIWLVLLALGLSFLLLITVQWIERRKRAD